uniref:Uncharacterized protein n=1 Tax=Anopheles coluzzii TaxID=1518534 RepID=A0A8W7PDT4_ANOCL
MSTFRGAIKRLNCDLKISTIFFDLDNTLIATRKADAKACSKRTRSTRSVEMSCTTLPVRLGK